MDNGKKRPNLQYALLTLTALVIFVVAASCALP